MKAIAFNDIDDRKILGGSKIPVKMRSIFREQVSPFFVPFLVPDNNVIYTAARPVWSPFIPVVPIHLAIGLESRKLKAIQAISLVNEQL